MVQSCFETTMQSNCDSLPMRHWGDSFRKNAMSTCTWCIILLMCSYGIQGESVCHDIDLGIGTVMESMIHALSRSVYRANIVAMQFKCTMNPTEENGTKVERCCIILWQGSIYVHASFHPPLHLVFCDSCCQSQLSCGYKRHNVCWTVHFSS